MKAVGPYSTMRAPSVLVTGANGFVGRAVMRRMGGLGAVRDLTPDADASSDIVAVGNIDETTDWRQALDGIRVVVHLAARVHVMEDRVANPLDDFRRVNVAGSLALARQAAGAGVRRLVYVSSIKVNGEATEPGRSFRAADKPNPRDPYGRSKAEAEEALQAVSASTGLELVIVRPPLVYGPGVRANFRMLMRWIVRGLPLPLGAVDNSRSLVALENLVDLLEVCTRHPSAPGQVFLAGDGEDLSTPELVRRLARALNQRARLYPVPTTLLLSLGTLIGQRAVTQRLCESLKVDISPTMAALGWSPTVDVDSALKEVARHFRMATGH
jgi:UDP-4-keto-D-QuiNAc 4-reductase